MAFYTYNLLAFGAIDAGLEYLQWRRDRKGAAAISQGQDVEVASAKAALMAREAMIRQFKKKYMPVFVLAYGADWLQGPYIYTMYRDEKGLAEEAVAQLFMTGFAAAAASALISGSLADRYGRKSACLFFCVAYSISCMTVLFDSIWILFAGRILGGVSTTLMYSVIESWMVTEFHRQHLEEAGSINDIFGQSQSLNGLAAILAGVYAQWIVYYTDTQAAPFMTAVALLVAAFYYISKYWNENYGDSHNANVNGLLPAGGEKSKTSFQYMQDKRLWALCLTSFAFEGSMYLWIFFKFPALRLSRKEAGLDENDLPFGIIFSGLMCAFVFGTLLYTYYSSLPPSRLVVSSSKILTWTLFVAGGCFILPVMVHDQAITFWCFCVFEICVGIYFPSIANLKEKIVEDGVRAKIYAWLRLPLNIFVVVGLMLTTEGLHYRENIFLSCAFALVTAATALTVFVREE